MESWTIFSYSVVLIFRRDEQRRYKLVTVDTSFSHSSVVQYRLDRNIDEYGNRDDRWSFSNEFAVRVSHSWPLTFTRFVCETVSFIAPFQSQCSKPNRDYGSTRSADWQFIVSDPPKCVLRCSILLHWWISHSWVTEPHMYPLQSLYKHVQLAERSLVHSSETGHSKLLSLQCLFQTKWVSGR